VQFTAYFAATRQRADRKDIALSWIQTMKITYFQDTDTLYIEFRAGAITESRDLDENTLIDLDAKGQICALTMEHARERADIPAFSFEQVTA